MNTKVSLETFYNTLRKLEEADSWRLDGKGHGTRAAKAIKPFRSKGGRVPAKGRVRYAPYQVERNKIKLKKTLLEQQVDEMFPSNACARHLKKLKIFLRLLLRQERKIVGPLHLILAETPSWNVMLMFYEKWKLTGLNEKVLPAYMWRAYDVYSGTSTDWSDIQVAENLVPESCVKWVGLEFWPIVLEKTGVDFRNACDFFPQSRIFRDHNDLQYPEDSDVYFNPPFGRYQHFFMHLWKQFLAGRIKNILLVMWWNKWHGKDNRKPVKWLKLLRDREEKTVFDLYYNFYRPDGKRHDEAKRFICVHVFV